MLRVLNDKVSPAIKLEELNKWDIFEQIQEIAGEEAKLAAMAAVSTEGFCSDMLPCEGAKDALLRIRELPVSITVVTAPWVSKTWVYERSAWLKKHFGIQREEIIHTHAKQLITGHLFIDDHVANVDKWGTHRGFDGAFLWNTQYNQHEGQHLKRLTSWQVLLEMLEERVKWKGQPQGQSLDGCAGLSAPIWFASSRRTCQCYTPRSTGY